MGSDFQLAPFCKNRPNIRTGVSLSNDPAQSDKDRERGTDVKQEGKEKKGN